MLLKKCLFICLAAIFCLFVFQFLLKYKKDVPSGYTKFKLPSPEQSGFSEKLVADNGIITTVDDTETSDASAILLWWTPFINDLEYTKNCGNSACFFTGNRKYFNHEKLKTLLFYGSDMNASNMPLPRKSNHIWALLHEESPKNVPYLLFEPTLSLFNLTATFSQHSDLPLTLQYLESYDKLIDRKYFVDVQSKSRFQTEENLAPVLFIQSICDTLSGRNDYVAELMKYIRIDSYGKCLNNNKKISKTLAGEDYLTTLDTEEFYKFIARYKFVIAYENGVCDDYITEKLWRPLSLGVVPVYFGAPNVNKWIPNNDSIIWIENFANPKKLAEHLLLLNNNDNKYNRLLEHKIHQKVTNEVLKKELERRNYETNSIVEDFECFACQKSIETSTVSLKHRHPDICDVDLVHPKMQNDFVAENNKWFNILKQGKCETKIIEELVTRNVPFTSDELQRELIRRFENGLCKL